MLSIPVPLRGLWNRALLRGIHFSDRHRRLDTLYLVADPWDLDSAREHFRFAQTNILIQREFGLVDNLLEIGCGEGHQSAYLTQVCDVLHGCDVSGRAVERAKVRCPSGRFSVGTVHDIDRGSHPPYDLVVACEVLYYVNDVRQEVEEISRLGRSCLITYYQSQRERLDALIAPPPGFGRTEISDGDNTWTAIWWQNK